jgi:RHH-type rel operon transcriptional repressor/antitoxin RelB
MATIELSAELDQRLEALARARGRSKAACLEDAVAAYLQDQTDVSLAAERTAAVRSGEEETVSLSDLLRRYGVAD